MFADVPSSEVFVVSAGGGSGAGSGSGSCSSAEATPILKMNKEKHTKRTSPIVVTKLFFMKHEKVFVFVYILKVWTI